MPEADKEIALYEKAFPESWELITKIEHCADLECTALEIAVDEEPNRLARLEWSENQKKSVRAALKANGITLQSITLSAHRSTPLGSPSDDVRKVARHVGEKAVGLAHDLDISIVQIAGYFATADDRDDSCRNRFVSELGRLSEFAERSGVLLALENVDGQDILTSGDGVSIVKEINSPALRLYVDLGNYAANGLDVEEELTEALPFAHAIQLKDTRRGEFRRVPFGEGIVPFPALLEQFYDDFVELPLSLEMWNDSDDLAIAREALTWFHTLWAKVSSDRSDRPLSGSHGHNH